MKKSIFLALLAGGLFLTGCETPGYTTQERFQSIGRNWGWNTNKSTTTLTKSSCSGRLTIFRSGTFSN